MDAALVDPVLTQTEVCQILRISRKTLQHWRTAGKIKYSRLGHRTIRIRCSDLPEPYRGDLVKSLVESVERAEGGAPSPVVTFEPDPTLAPDAGQFFTTVLLDHVEPCCHEECGEETRLAVRLNDGQESRQLLPACKDHVHVMFSEWMVGA